MPVTYDAHVGIMQEGEGKYVIFCNWDEFLAEYYLTTDTAHKILVNGSKEPRIPQAASASDTAIQESEKLRDSFRNYAPTLYKVLTEENFPIKPCQRLCVGTQSLNALTVTVQAESEAAAAQHPFFSALIATGLQICREVNTTTHLAIWRRYLQTVWLHE